MVDRQTLFGEGERVGLVLVLENRVREKGQKVKKGNPSCFM